MTLKCFYSPVQSECKEKTCTLSSYNIPMRRCCAAVIQATQGLIEYTTHTSDRKLLSPQNANPIFQTRKEGEHVHRHSPAVSLCLHQLIDCYYETESAAVQISKPGDREMCCLSVVQTPWLFLPTQLTITFSFILSAYCLCNFIQ